MLTIQPGNIKSTMQSHTAYVTYFKWNVIIATTILLLCVTLIPHIKMSWIGTGIYIKMELT
jgi:hypothetical protein